MRHRVGWCSQTHYMPFDGEKKRGPFLVPQKKKIGFPDEGQGPKIRTRVKNYHSVYLLFPPEFSFELLKKLTPEVAPTLPWGYIHVYYHSSQTSLLVYVSGERLQDHWSSCSFIAIQ